MKSENSEYCKKCSEQCDPYEKPAVRCELCEQLVHVACLNRGALPSNLLGDVFYDLSCKECSPTGEERFTRQKLSWFLAIVLSLYNLREKSYGISRRGYFHWKTHICEFIRTRWDKLFNKKQKKNWRGTISGTLSAYKDEFFQSGTEELEGEQGWWKLIPNDIPEVIINYFKESKKEGGRFKGKSATVKPKLELNCNNENSNESTRLQLTEKRSTHTNYEQESTSGIPSSISSNDDFEDMDIGIPNIGDDLAFHLIENTIEEGLPFLDGNELSEIFNSDCFNIQDEIDVIDIFDESVLQEEKFVEKESNTKLLNITEELDTPDKNNSSKSNDLPAPCPSLFTQSKRKSTLLDEPPIKFKKECIRPLMNERQEEYLLQKLEENKPLLNTAPASVYRLYRKLKVRKEKRQLGLPVFDIDKFGKINKNFDSKKITNILDKFMPEDFRILFEQRLQGPCELTPIYIPDVDRKLDPLIWRYPDCPAPWLKVTEELLTKVNHKKPGWEPQARAPIDFSYVRPQHIPAMNSLCSQFFWPGVDLTECLQHPHTTCVALYKKLVVGFAVMVPDVSFNEAYISFLFVRPEWQRAKIGTFMLYHLTQTVWTKDITLHVSVSNPAMVLYSKFGFQIEGFLKNFYDKYIPPSSKESKNAFFLRLK